MSDDAQQVAEAAAAAMWKDDQASQALGMRVVTVGPGRAVLSMTVRPDMTNGHGIGHGGFTFALADSAFAFACNSYDRRTVAARCDIAFLAPIREGDELVAEAVERHRAGRNGIYDVAVRRGDEVVAEFRGTSREVGGSLTDS
ncbi:MAG TPA: hydroxyphenylacetyl-CoA thioesterase PaaI [Nocardioidaceae bacterium]|nr:hydroxyphenylacetyl-CoA thioesterase PaaI [Nocardioidaceae bacterium]